MIRAALLCCLLPGLAAAQTLNLPSGAERTFATSEIGTASIAVGKLQAGKVPTIQVAGQVSRRSWRIEGHVPTWDIVTSLTDQLTGLGYEVRVSCKDEDCGGFDFRFGIEVLDEPEMHVNMGDFRYLAAERGAGSERSAVAALVSSGPGATFVQLVTVMPPDTAAPPAQDLVPAAEPAPTQPPPEAPDGLADALATDGHVVLHDLSFDSGSSTLGPGPYASLAELAAFLAADPRRSVVVVGHTDAVGGLPANEAISEARAASVRQRLIDGYGVNAAQVSSDGVGYLSPRASNLTEAGREANRRVEAVLLSTN